MLVKDLIKALEKVDKDAKVTLVVYTSDSYESGYLDDVHSHLKYDSVTQRKLEDDESVVELVTSTRGK